MRRIITLLCLVSTLSCVQPALDNDCDHISACTLLGFTYLTGVSFSTTNNRINRTYTGIISGPSVSIELPYGISKSAVITLSTNAASILAGGAAFTNGVTPLDFSVPVNFTLKGNTGAPQYYTVTAYLITPVADTNQSNCYAGGVLSSCPATTSSDPSQDAHFIDLPNAKGIQPSVVNPLYTSDSINPDRLRGLVWKTCQEGFTGIACGGGSLSPLTHAAAGTSCANLNSVNSGAGYAGLKKWRLPTLQELNQLLEQDQAGNIFWNTSLFPNAPSTVGANLYRWTSSMILPAATSAMAVNELHQPQATGTTNPVHCVNGDSPPAADLLDNGDGTVLDRRTKLIWQKCSMGQANDTGCSGALGTASWSGALVYCKNLNLAGKTWRLPSITELVTLLDISKPAPFLDTIRFPNLTIADFHSSTTQMSNVVYNYILTLSTPAVGGLSGKGTPYNVKCVSGP